MARALVVALLAAAALPGAARASQLIDRDATGVQLHVSRGGDALVTYRAGGRVRHVLAWGAVNAISPARGRAQVAFPLHYAGGWGVFPPAPFKGVGETCLPDAG